MFRRLDSPIRSAGFYYSMISLFVGILVCTPLAVQRKGTADVGRGVYNRSLRPRRMEIVSSTEG
jgi:hypothetical protein